VQHAAVNLPAHYSDNFNDNVNAAHGCLHFVDEGGGTDVLEVYAASIFRVKVCIVVSLILSKYKPTLCKHPRDLTMTATAKA
jgi:hypothetical protein